jgi:hypothetical protein
MDRKKQIFLASILFRIIEISLFSYVGFLYNESLQDKILSSLIFFLVTELIILLVMAFINTSTKITTFFHPFDLIGSKRIYHDNFDYVLMNEYKRNIYIYDVGFLYFKLVRIIEFNTSDSNSIINKIKLNLDIEYDNKKRKEREKEEKRKSEKNRFIDQWDGYFTEEERKRNRRKEKIKDLSS